MDLLYLDEWFIVSAQCFAGLYVLQKIMHYFIFSGVALQKTSGSTAFFAAYSMRIEYYVLTRNTFIKQTASILYYETPCSYIFKADRRRQISCGTFMTV